LELLLIIFTKKGIQDRKICKDSLKITSIVPLMSCLFLKALPLNDMEIIILCP